MDGFKKVKTDYCGGFDFIDRNVKSIIGTNSTVQSMYEKGILNNEMELVGSHGLYGMYLASGGTRRPDCVIDLFRYIVKSIESKEGHKVSVQNMTIEDMGDTINVVVDYGKSVLKVIVHNTENGLVFIDNHLKGYHYFENPDELVDKLENVLRYLTKISPVPLHGMEYWVCSEVHSFENIGVRSRYYTGLAHADRYNALDHLEGIDLYDCIEGEYVLAFLETGEIKSNMVSKKKGKK